MFALDDDDPGRHDWLRLLALKPGWEVLEIGPRSGGLTLALRKAGCRVVTFDAAADLLGALRASLAKRTGVRPLHLVVGDLLDLPFPDRRFDAVTFIHGLEGIVDPLEAKGVEARILVDALASVGRVLRPKGRFVTSVRKADAAIGGKDDLFSSCQDCFGEVGLRCRATYMPLPDDEAFRMLAPIEAGALAQIREIAADLASDPDLEIGQRSICLAVGQARSRQALIEAAPAYIFDLEKP